MKLILQIAAGVIIGMSVVHFAEYTIAKYQVQIALEELTNEMERQTTNFQETTPESAEFTLIKRNIEPKPKPECLRLSGNIYNDTYLKCRQGQRLTIKRNEITGKETVIASEPIMVNGS